ncbi:MAG: hypothetical protein JW725_02170 [Candidatus Babeliaceae bacterium]|nr:hypothetical protein [Candidatus Babeliaceae bacterium]
MPVISELRDDIKKYISNHGLSKKWEKARQAAVTKYEHGKMEKRVTRLEREVDVLRPHLAA